LISKFDNEQDTPRLRATIAPDGSVASGEVCFFLISDSEFSLFDAELRRARKFRRVVEVVVNPSAVGNVDRGGHPGTLRRRRKHPPRAYRRRCSRGSIARTLVPISRRFTIGSEPRGSVVVTGCVAGYRAGKPPPPPPCDRDRGRRRSRFSRKVPTLHEKEKVHRRRGG